MKQFLREMWELWYWSMFCPSKLQQRINDWRPSEYKPNTFISELLLFPIHWRFLSQYLCLIILFSSPLLIILSAYILQHPQVLSFWIAAIAVAYGLGVLSWPALGIHSPLLFALVYSQTSLSPQWEKVTILLSKNYYPQALTGFTLLGMMLIIAILTEWLLFSKKIVFLGKGKSLNPPEGSHIFSVDRTLFLFPDPLTITGILLAVFLIITLTVLTTLFILIFIIGHEAKIIFLAATITIFSVVFLCFFWADFIVEGLSAVTMITGIVITIFVGAIAGLLVSEIALLIQDLIVGFEQFSFLDYMFIGMGASILFSPKKKLFIGLGIALAWFLLGFRYFSWNTLWVIPIILIGYYRIFPDYIATTLLNWQLFIPWIVSDSESINILHRLPPYSTELLWIPILNHHHILIYAFRANPRETLLIFQEMQSDRLPGNHLATDFALPQIVADQLNAVKTVGDLIQIQDIAHPFLPILVPHLYPSTTELERSEELERLDSAPKGDGKQLEINILLPKFKTFALDIQSVLQSNSEIIQQRGLERVLNSKIVPFSSRLPGLGLRQPAIDRWQPVILHWQNIIEQELEQRKHMFQGELLNPFIYGNPLRRNQTDVFKGRQAFADDILRLVLDRNRPTLVLHGPRRSGKSSFLLNLPGLLPSDIIPVYLDMQRQSASNSDEDFCYALAHAIRRDSRGQGVQLPVLPKRQEFYDNPYPLLDDWLDEALPELGDRRLLLGLDEFEKIGSAITEGRMTIRILDQLRSLIQHSDRLGFLFSGVQTLDELGPNWSSYFISVVPMKMLYLNPDEAEDLLTNPDPDFDLRYDEGVIDQILTLTRCHPYLVQLLGWSLVKLANQQQTRLATTQLLDDAIPEAFNNGEPYFTNVWTEFTGTTPAQVAAGQTLLLNLAQGNVNIATDPDTQAALRRLTRFHILEQTADGYRFEIPLMQQWVATRAILSADFADFAD